MKLWQKIAIPALFAGVMAAGVPKDAQAQEIKIDGSSTVFPISEALAEEFQISKRGKVRVTVGIAGSGGGFKKFCRGETDISNASRPIMAEEMENCRKAGIKYIELPIAFDALTVVINPQNSWAKSMTVADLKKIWEPGAQGRINNWSQVRAGFPAEKMTLFGPGTDSGTFDYFTEAVNGKSKSSRADYSASEDDNTLVQGVENSKGALGYFGFAYYVENQDKLKLVPVDDGKDDNGKGPIAPSPETVANGTYQPLSRPIFIYVSKAATNTPSVKAFVDFYLANAATLSKEVGYIPLPDASYALVKQRFAAGTVGSVFGGSGSKVGATVEALLGNGK